MFFPTLSQTGKAVVHYFSRTFMALKYRNYRLWFIGQLISLFGTWMQTTAQGFLIFELTHSPAQLGIVAFAAGVPTWGLMLYGGIIADRFSKRLILVWTQSALMMTALVLAFLAFTHLVQPWHITLLAFITGIANAFDAPVRQAFTVELVERTDLANAIALNATMFNAASIMGPAMAGMTYAVYGPAWCFLINAVSFLAIIVSLLFMDNMVTIKRTSGKTLAELKEGLHYIVNEPVIFPMIIMIAVSSLFGLSYTTLLPAWAHQILHGDARTLGYLHAMRGAGAMCGALAIASFGHAMNKRRELFAAAIVVPFTLIFFAQTSQTWMALMALFLVGASTMFVMNLANAIVQTTVTDRLRGRVMSVYGLMFFGMMPVGGLLVGGIAEFLGERLSIIVCACGLAATASIMPWWMSRRIKPVQLPKTRDSSEA